MRIIHNLDEWNAFRRATDEVPEVFPVIGYMAEIVRFVTVSKFKHFPAFVLDDYQKALAYFEGFEDGFLLGEANV